MMTMIAENGYQKGLELMQKGLYKKAIRAFDHAISSKIKFADAYFQRGVCFYKLGHSRRAHSDLEAAALLGCEAAQFWSKYDQNKFQKSDEDNEP